MPVNDPIAFAESHWRIALKKKCGNEYSGQCPKCGGVDRFLLWVDRQNFWCRQCGYEGFLDAQGDVEPTSDQDKLKWEVEQLKRRVAEHDRRINALEEMHRCTDHLRYHNEMTTGQMEYWLDEGMTVDTIVRYQLGYCPRCPTDKEGRPSYTIPVRDRDGQLCNIRHRLAGVTSDKYRPHRSGLGAQLFNSQFTTQPTSSIIITEGEKKSIILAQEGFANVGIMGKTNFMKSWLPWFDDFGRIYVALDPDADRDGSKLAAAFDGRGYTVNLPVKADDFFVRYGGDRNDFEQYLKWARPISRRH